jgi:hypothetical protein
MSAIDDAAGEAQEILGRGASEATRLRFASFTLCPKDQLANKRTKVIEPNVSVSTLMMTSG